VGGHIVRSSEIPQFYLVGLLYFDGIPLRDCIDSHKPVIISMC
jgi:hypothetical protein